MASASIMECHVCLEGFNAQKKPKILLCAHILCNRCLLSLIESKGTRCSCPVCRVPIFPFPDQIDVPRLVDTFPVNAQIGLSDLVDTLPVNEQIVLSDLVDPFTVNAQTGLSDVQVDIFPINAQTDLSDLVDIFPTDLVIDTLAACQETLSSPHVCSSCSKSTEVSSFCLQCSVKLCTACAEGHVENCSKPGHMVKKLSDLTAEQLAVHHRLVCSKHENVVFEKYCTRHACLVCERCRVCHDSCQDVWESIPVVAPVMREELRREVKLLACMDRELDDKISKVSEVHTRFVTRRTGLDKDTAGHHQISLKEIDSCLKELQQPIDYVKILQTVLIGCRNMARRLVADASDAVLLMMMKDMKARLMQFSSKIVTRQEEEVHKTEEKLNHLFEELDRPTLWSWIKPQMKKSKKKKGRK